MKTLYEIAADIFTALNVSEVLTNISGKVYNGNIPEGVQDLENISVNTLVLGQSQLQRGLVNVNIHVPDLQTKVNGQNFTGNADDARLSEISKIVIPLIENAEILDLQLKLQPVSKFEERQKNQHYYNIRVETYTPNLK